MANTFCKASELMFAIYKYVNMTQSISSLLTSKGKTQIHSNPFLNKCLIIFTWIPDNEK